MVWLLAAMALAGVVGYVVGSVVVPRRRRRQEAAVRVLHGPTTFEVVNTVFRRAPYAMAVVDRFEDVILHNRRAEELGVMSGTRLVESAWNAAILSFESLGTTDFHIQYPVSRTRRSVVSVRGHASVLTDHGHRFVVIFADDDSESRRMEAARRDFVANVSHELKTPVGAMAVLAEALMESTDDAESVDYFGNRILTEAHRLGYMVTELIELSRLQGAEKVRDPELVDVDELVQECMSRSAEAAAEANIDLTCDNPSGLEVMGDRTLLITALSNLVRNAINYSPHQTPVTVTRSAVDGRVCLRVTDRGIGIAPEFQSRVFERFFRVDKARSRATGGTGLGLAIVKHVVQNHDGQVRLWSRPGMGSTFTIELPAHIESDHDDSDASGASNIHGQGPEPNPNPRRLPQNTPNNREDIAS